MPQTALAAIDEQLLTKQLVFVTGKGGVGKSVVSAALALRAHALGTQPLLFECDAPARQSLFPRGARVAAQIAEVYPGVLALNQSSDDAIRDYATHALPSETLAKLLFENRVSRLFLKASPSVTEMALIGRMVQLAEERKGKGPVIVDLHSTGHALHVLRAPQGIMRVLRKGPVYERAKAARDFIFDPGRAVVLTVALPEELPVTELLEFMEQLTELGAPLGPTLLNGMFDDPVPGVNDETLRSLADAAPETARACADARTLRAWAERAQREHDRLLSGVGDAGGSGEVLALPFVMETGPNDTLATRLFSHLDTIAPPAKPGAHDGG
jgi:anion-transporting  ArsA/GET3 family ATPase